MAKLKPTVKYRPNMIDPPALPAHETKGAAGADIRAATAAIIKPGERALIATGYDIEIPEGWKIDVKPRSGLALNKGITVLNSPGLVDSDYRGPLGVILINTSNEVFIVNFGDRIAQIEIAPSYQAAHVLADELSSTDRGTGGFGSTGV